MNSATDRPTSQLTPHAGPGAPPEAAPAPAAPAPVPPLELPLWKRMLFGAIMVLIVYALLELIASTYLRVTRGYDGEHLYEFEFDPYKNILPARNFADTRGVRHNAQGFRRDDNVSLVKPPGTYRIFLMGGSTAYGTGGLWPHIQREFAVIPNEATIDRYLERDLAAAFPGSKIEVINAAITSTWTHHHLIYLNQSLLRYDPDAVLFLDGFNDFFFTSEEHDQFGSYLYNTQAQGILGDPSVGSLVKANAWWFYRASPLAHVTIKALRNLVAIATAPEPGERTPMDVDRAMAGLEQNFPANALKMHRRSGLILQDEGVRPIFMLQPILALERGRKPLTAVEQQLFEFNLASYLPNYEPFLHRAADFVRAEEQKMAADVGGEFIDLTGIYAGVEEQIYTDYVHLTPRGNERLAKVVAERLIPLVRADLDSAGAVGVVARR